MPNTKNQNIHVGIIYPSDPLGSIPGGIETFIRGIIGWAPEDIEFSLIGITTDARSRPVGTWSECRQGRNTFMFFPLYAMAEPGKRPRIPATVRYTALLFKEARKYKFDVLDSHRIEPFLPYLSDKTPKNVFLHQNMEVISSKSSDIRWKHLPWLYYKIEDLFLHRINSVYAVREDAVRAYRKRYHDIQSRFNFIPTWVDPDIFFPVKDGERTELKKELQALYEIPEDDLLMASVGRLDTQKDPVLLVESFHRVAQDNNKIHLLMVGDGLLRPDVEKKIAELGLKEKVSLVGLLSPHKVARCLQASDMFVLSSAYEGMPMCVLEALGCGLPVATTDVGEVRRVVEPGTNGEIAAARAVDELASAMTVTMQNLSRYRGTPCLDTALEYVPDKVLMPVYENYRRLAQMGRT